MSGQKNEITLDMYQRINPTWLSIVISIII